METEEKKYSKLIWSPKMIEQLSQYVSDDVLKRFQEQWDRILDGTGFYMIPYSEEANECMKSAYFWRNIIADILKYYTADQIAVRSGLLLSEIIELADEDKGETFYMPLAAGEKLLELHKELEIEIVES